MGNCCGGSAIVPQSSPHLLPAPTQGIAPSTHLTSAPSSHLASSSSKMPAHGTTQHDYEMPTLLRKQSAVASERMPSQDSTYAPRHRDDRDNPPSPSGSNPQNQEHIFKSRGRVPPRLRKSISMDTPFPQRPRSRSPSRMTRTPSAFLGQGPQPTGTQVESGQASGTGQIPAGRRERRLLFPSTLQSLLSNDFRCVVRYRAVTHNNNCCTIIHRFRILVVGKVCIMYHTGRRRN